MEGKEKEKDEVVSFFGINLSSLSFTWLFAFFAGVVFATYAVFSYIQEYIFLMFEGFTYGWFVTLYISVVFVIGASFELTVQSIRGSPTNSADASDGKTRTLNKIPIYQYVILSLLTAITMGFSNTSLLYLNYPTQIVFKSSKTIPVMIGGVLLLRKRYSSLEYLSALLLCGGLVIFTLADVSTRPQFDIRGVLLLSCSLVADAFIGNLQEKTLSEYNRPMKEMVLFTYLFGGLCALAYQLATGDLYLALEFCSKNTNIYPWLTVLSLTSYIGVSAVLNLVKISGALSAVITTSFRKVLSMVLSFVLFPKPFNLMYIYGAIAIFGAIFLNFYAKHPKEVIAFKDKIVRFFNQKEAEPSFV
eukprot:TRINITY_DN283_c0_g5_i1.p1 TRINITY_DN283_c0_g5~~TRINITY_DN283_c0_g5_i1.p1  ORF type:complete len:360 (+),score=59.85 TRINITY_DN283_c0_g5_i1:353-1432(+)